MFAWSQTPSWGGQSALISKMKCLNVLSYKLTMCGTGSVKMGFVSMMEF